MRVAGADVPGPLPQARHVLRLLERGPLERAQPRRERLAPLRRDLPDRADLYHRPPQSEKDAKLAQKLDQLQPSTAAFSQECMGKLAYFGPT